MAQRTLSVRQKQKYDTSTNWATNNPVLLAGEIGIESDTHKMKAGDGVTAWNSLGYISIPYTETDPTVPSWAKQANKPTYDYSEITNTPTIPTVNDATLTLQLNGSQIDTFTANASANKTINVQALPNYSLSIGSTNGGNPRQVLFTRVNYTNFDSNSGAYFKLGAMSGHGNGSSYTFVEDVFINVNYQGTVTCEVYKYVQQSVTLDGVTRNYGDIFWTIDTTNKIVDFYILLGQYSSAQFTPATKIGAAKAVTTANGITQYSGTPTYYSSGTKTWATGNSTLYARLSDIPDTSNFVDTTSNQNIKGSKHFIAPSGGSSSVVLGENNKNITNDAFNVTSAILFKNLTAVIGGIYASSVDYAPVLVGYNNGTYVRPKIRTNGSTIKDILIDGDNISRLTNDSGYKKSISTGSVQTTKSSNGTSTSTTVTIPSGAVVTGINVNHSSGNQYGNGAIWGLSGYSVSGTTVTINLARPNNDNSPTSRIVVFYAILS